MFHGAGTFGSIAGAAQQQAGQRRYLFFGSKIRGQNTYMSAGSLVSLSSRYFTALTAMHDAQTQGKAPRARRRPP